MAKSSTSYKDEIAFADVGGHRIERIWVKHNDQEEIRFSWWPNGKFVPRPLDLTEEELLEVMAVAIRNGVFKDEFLDALSDLLANRPTK